MFDVRLGARRTARHRRILVCIANKFIVRACRLLSASLVAAGYLFERSRFFLYASLVICAAAGVWFAGARWEWALLLSGALILVFGLLVLTRFLRPYPRAGGRPLV